MHPRLRHYPHHRDYMDMRSEFRPYIMYTNQPGYQSPSVNVDRFGFREQYDAQLRFMDLARLRDTYRGCNLFVGSSTAFGVDATSDRATVPFYLNEPDIPFVNFGIRGALSQQEVMSFMLHKHLLPPIANIVLFTGVNGPSFAALEDTLYFEDFGGIFSEEFIFRRFWEIYRQFEDNQALNAKMRFQEALQRWICNWYENSSIARTLASLLMLNSRRVPSQTQRKPRLSFAEKLALVNRFFVNDLDTWKVIQRGTGCRIHFVLQPCIGWTNKKLTPIESECFDEDMKLTPSMQAYTTMAMYNDYRKSVRQACDQADIEFHDANEWLNEPQFEKQDVFTDVCHLTDYGQLALGDFLRHKLRWKNTE